MGYREVPRRFLTTLVPPYGVRCPLERPIPRCLWGANLAPQEEFDWQAAEADRILDHYKLYVVIFRRLFKCSPVIGDACAAEGGQSRGIEASAEAPSAYSGTSGEFSVVSGRVCYVLGLAGPCVALATAWKYEFGCIGIDNDHDQCETAHRLTIEQLKTYLCK